MADVLDGLGLERRVGRVVELRVGPHQLGVLEHAHAVGRAALGRRTRRDRTGRCRPTRRGRRTSGLPGSWSSRARPGPGCRPRRRASPRAGRPPGSGRRPAASCPSRSRCRRASTWMSDARVAEASGFPAAADLGESPAHEHGRGHGQTAEGRQVGEPGRHGSPSGGRCRPSRANGCDRGPWRRRPLAGSPAGPRRRAASRSTAVRRPASRSGCVASMRRATPRRSRADRMATATQARPEASARAANPATTTMARTPAAASRPPTRAQAEPAEGQAAPEANLADPARDPFQRLRQFPAHDTGASARFGRGRPRPSRQPGLDDQDPDRRQDQRPPELLAALQLRVLHLPHHLALGFDARRAHRQAAAELLQRLDVQGGRLALRRVEVHRELAGPLGGLDHVDAGLVGVGERRGPRREPRRRAVRLADGDGPFGQRHALLDEPIGARGPVRRSAPSSRADISGTNFDERASWLSAGLQPLARTTSRPFPSAFSMRAGSPFSKRARTRTSPSGAVGDAPMFPELDLGEVVELRRRRAGRTADGRRRSPPASRRRGRASPPRPGPGRPPGPTRVGALPAAVTTASTVPPARANCRRDATFSAEVSAASTISGIDRSGLEGQAEPPAIATRASRLRRGVSWKTRLR